MKIREILVKILLIILIKKIICRKMLSLFDLAPKGQGHFRNHKPGTKQKYVNPENPSRDLLFNEADTSLHSTSNPSYVNRITYHLKDTQN